MLFGILWFVSCERIYEEPKENIDEAIEFASGIHAPFALFEAVEHISESLMSAGLYYQNLKPIEDELGVRIDLVDSSFANDDSAFFFIHFSGEAQNSFDRRIKLGTLKVIVYYDFYEPNSQFKVFTVDQEPFEMKLSNGDVFELLGAIEIERVNPSNKIIHWNHIELIHRKPSQSKEVGHWNIVGTTEVETKSGIQTPGLNGDVIRYSGSAQWEPLISTACFWEVSLPLEMRFNRGCSDYLNKGMITLQRGVNRYSINFDPFGTAACNRIVEIIKAGKPFEVNLP